jgi:hypothetical protein
MKASALALGIAVLAAAAPAQAETWRSSSSGMGAVAYIDTDSIRRDGDRVSFWREVRWPEARTLDSGGRFDRIAARYEGDCRAMTLRPIEIRAKLAGEIVFSGDSTAEVETPPPGTNGHTDLRAACFGDWPAAN